MKLWGVAFLLMSVITGLRYNHEWCYFLRIDKSGSLVGNVPLETRNQGLSGLSVKYIDADPECADRVAIANNYAAYVSTDHGASWIQLEGVDHKLLWVGKMLLGVYLGKISYSTDLGRTWTPVELENKDDYGYPCLIRDDKGRGWVQHSIGSDDYYYRIEKNDKEIKVKRIHSPEISEAVSTIKIQVKGGGIIRTCGSSTGRTLGSNRPRTLLPCDRGFNMGRA